MVNTYSAKEIELLQMLYPDNPTKSIVKFFPNRSIYSLKEKAKSLKLHKAQATINYAHNKKYSINEDFFNVQSHDMYYILGFIYADGCIRLKDYRLEFHLKKTDRNLLSRILSEMRSNHRIYDTDKSAKVVIANKNIYYSLLKYGLHDRKSLDLDFPYIPKEYMSDFIRGFFDGDGSVAKKHYYVKILGTKPFLEKLKGILEHNGIKVHSIVEANPNKVDSSHLTYVLYITKKDECEKFGNFIYQNNPKLYLGRKYIRFYA